MSEPALVAEISNDFRRVTAGAVEGARLGLSTGVWRFREACFEVETSARPDVHIITPYLRGVADHELLLDGRTRYRREMRSGMFNLVRAGEQPRAIVREANYEAMLVFLPDRLVRECAAGDEGREQAVELLPIGCETDNTIDRLSRAIRSEMLAPVIASRLMVDGLSLQLAAHMVRRWSNLRVANHNAKSPAAGGSDWRLRRAIEYLDANAAHDIGLAELAALVGLTATHLTKLFRVGVGEPPHRWLMRRRFERACELLADPGVSVTQVAAACGFASSQHLATVFRKRLGVSPTQYRRERLS